MKTLKKIFFTLFLALGCMAFSVTAVHAAPGKIEVVEDPNPEGVTGFALPRPGEDESEENPSDEDENEENPSDEEESGNN